MAPGIMTLTVKKKSLQEYKLKHFQSNAFREDLLSELLNVNIEKSVEGFTEFFETCNKHLK